MALGRFRLHRQLLYTVPYLVITSFSDVEHVQSRPCQAELCLDQMRQASVEPDHISFNTLISAGTTDLGPTWGMAQKVSSDSLDIETY